MIAAPGAVISNPRPKMGKLRSTFSSFVHLSFAFFSRSSRLVLYFYDGELYPDKTLFPSGPIRAQP